MSREIAAHYLTEARRQLRGQKKLAEDAMAQLSDDELLHCLDAESNSVALLVRHMAGNMRSRFTDFLTSDGEKPDRNRDREFELDQRPTRDQILGWWEQGWECVFAALDSLEPGQLLSTVTVRGEPHSVLQAVNRQIAHYAYHTGQIVFLAKHLRSSGWRSLSIPRGKSEEINARFRAKYFPAAPQPPQPRRG